MELGNRGPQELGALRGEDGDRSLPWPAFAALVLISISSAHFVEGMHAYADSRSEARRVLTGIEEDAANEHIGQIEALTQRRASGETAEEIEDRAGKEG